MAIKISSLRAAATRSRQTAALAFSEAYERKQTAFLCHSHADRDLAKGLQTLLSENGWDVYIDWDDSEMPDEPNAETAGRIKSKIKEPVIKFV